MLPLHPSYTSSSIDWIWHLVPNWSCLWTTKGGRYPYSRVYTHFTYIEYSMNLLKKLMSECWLKIQIMPRCCSNLVGFIINKTHHSAIRLSLFSIWRDLWNLTAMMRNHGICLEDAIWQNRTTTRHTRLISRLCIVMHVIPRSGALLVCCTTKSTRYERFFPFCILVLLTSMSI